jgi:DNA helicase II / ATP-dependent DNA helicase PcrA
MNGLLDSLNPEQLEAVKIKSQYSLLLAGAGSGKTKTLTTRIVYLINELKVNPRRILAVTFTNKAANEMKERAISYSEECRDVMIKTFHSFGAYVLRMEHSSAERNNNFQIYDDDDSRKLLLSILKKYGLAKAVLSSFKRWVSNYKQNLEDYSKMDIKDDGYLEMYNLYNKLLREANCFDFEDLILEPVKLFSRYPEILFKYNRRFQYILIDEYQDTNQVQYELIKLLCRDNANLMVVGDEDQSIYRFRGADVNIILNFPKDFDTARVIRLEENYRSTSNILNIANNVIKNNEKRLGKNLFTKGNEGEKVILFRAYNEFDEAEKITNIILDNDFAYNETTVLYRTNYQSRAFETVFSRNKIPYIVIGSVAFFEREEIKDSIAVMKWLVNPNDKIAFERFANKPARGLGDKTLQVFYEKALFFDNDLFKTLENVSSTKTFSKKINEGFDLLWNVFKDKTEVIEEKPVSELLIYYLDELGLLEYFQKEDEKENTEKIKNIREFATSIKDKGQGMDDLLTFLEDFTLTASSLNDEKDDSKKVKLMTIHNAKGLEFENVFIAGVENGLFPHINSLEDDDIEEERRLFYVAITRAKKNLFISFCEFRNVFGQEDFRGASSFISEIPKEYVELKYFSQNDTDEFGFEEIKTDKKTDFEKGDVVKHKDYGKGKILSIRLVNKKHLATVDFWDYSCMELVLEYSKLEKVKFGD